MRKFLIPLTLKGEYMKVNKWIPICIIVGLIVTVGGCTNPQAQSVATAQSSDDNAEVYNPSWMSPNTLEDLVWSADLVIEGTITGIQETWLEYEHDIFTDYKVDVSKVLKSSPGFADRSVIIKHFGGTYQGRTQIMREDEPYQVGQKMLLFLKDISVFPGQTRAGEKKYSVMMPGGRFHIQPDGKLDTPTKNLAVADTYRGKDKSVLEKDIQIRIPTTADYLQRAVEGSFLIAEGTVGQVQKTWMSMEGVTPEQLAELKARGQLPELAYTFYSFTVDQILEDKLERYKDAPRKTPLYKSSPVHVSEVITVLEPGGTYEGITQRRTLIPFLKPGDRMLLFLNAIGCGERLSICSQAEQDTNKVLYILGDLTDRFLIGLDNRLTALTPGVISRSYDNQPKSRLEQDIIAAQVKWEKRLEELKKQPTSVPPAFPPPPTAAPRR